MKVAAIHQHGDLDQIKIETWDEPVPSKGEVLIDIAACGLNYLDVFVLVGMPGLPVAMPRIPGGDIAGSRLEAEIKGGGTNWYRLLEHLPSCYSRGAQASSDRRISVGLGMRSVLRSSLRRVFVCSHITFSVEFANARLRPQLLHTPRLSRPFGVSIIQ